MNRCGIFPHLQIWIICFGEHVGTPSRCGLIKHHPLQSCHLHAEARMHEKIY